MTNGTSESLPSVPTKSSSSPLILGHRGASAHAPENTLAAFSLAMSDGADGIEFDVRLARDQVPVVIHDATLKRTAGVDARVSELTAAELQQIDVGRWFDRKKRAAAFITAPFITAPFITAPFINEKLPTLAQVFDLFGGNRGVLYVEMKCEPEEAAALASAVVRLTREARLTERVVVESFDLNAIAEVKRIDGGIRTAALFEPKLSRPISTLRKLKMVDIARGVGADEIALHHTLAGARVCEKAKREGLEVVLWTVDDPRWIPRARSLGVKALIANDPGMMVRHR
jgi:glycerophosphoryl diester phosphodiesterase